MAAAYPDLSAADRDASPELRAAFELIAIMRSVGDATAKYKLELRLASERDDDLPF